MEKHDFEEHEFEQLFKFALDAITVIDGEMLTDICILYSVLQTNLENLHQKEDPEHGKMIGGLSIVIIMNHFIERWFSAFNIINFMNKKKLLEKLPNIFENEELRENFKYTSIPFSDVVRAMDDLNSLYGKNKKIDE